MGREGFSKKWLTEVWPGFPLAVACQLVPMLVSTTGARLLLITRGSTVSMFLRIQTPLFIEPQERNNFCNLYNSYFLSCDQLIPIMIETRKGTLHWGNPDFYLQKYNLPKESHSYHTWTPSHTTALRELQEKPIMMKQMSDLIFALIHTVVGSIKTPIPMKLQGRQYFRIFTTVWIR